MSRLEQVHREGIDLEVALTSEMRRLEGERPESRRPAGGSLDHLSSTRPAWRPRAWLGRVGRGIGARAKVVLRPPMVRIRHFMLAPLEEELRQTRQRVEEIGEYAGRVAVPLGDWDVLLRTNAGYVVCASADVLVLSSLIEGGDLERGTRLLIERLVRPGDVVVDAGAHIGLHTLAAARALRGRGMVHAIEPFEPSARRLRQAVLINGLSGVVAVHQAAVSDHAGSQPLHLGVVSGHHSLFPLSASDASGEGSVEVPLVRIDDIVKDGPVALMKLDVEGAELDALDGARAAIERTPELALIVEFGPSHLARVGTPTKTWFDRFQGLGLTFRAIDSGTGRLRTTSIASLEALDSTNLLFARPEARVWTRI